MCVVRSIRYPRIYPFYVTLSDVYIIRVRHIHASPSRWDSTLLVECSILRQLSIMLLCGGLQITPLPLKLPPKWQTRGMFTVVVSFHFDPLDYKLGDHVARHGGCLNGLTSTRLVAMHVFCLIQCGHLKLLPLATCAMMVRWLCFFHPKARFPPYTGDQVTDFKKCLASAIRIEEGEGVISNISA